MQLSRFDPPKGPPWQRQTACKPGSVPLSGSPEGGDGHSSWALVAERLVRPTRAAARRLARHLGSLWDACRSYLVLLPVGFSLPPPLPAARCALAAPFHPCRPPGVPRRTGGVLSVALSLGSPPPGVTRHRTSVEPGLSSLRTRRRAAIRPSGNQRFGHRRRGCRGSCAWVPGSQLRRAPDRQPFKLLYDRFVEVAPLRVLLVDEPDLPIAPPLFEFLLATDRGHRIVIDLEPDQAIDTVSPREPRGWFWSCARGYGGRD